VISDQQRRPADQLPLLELFYRLREAELPLGITEYELLPRAMLAGFGFDGVKSLMDLCRMLWIKTPDEEIIFQHIFAQWLAERRSMKRAPDPESEADREGDRESQPPTTPDEGQQVDEDKGESERSRKPVSAGKEDEREAPKETEEEALDTVGEELGRGDEGEQLTREPRRPPPHRDRPKVGRAVSGTADEATHFLMTGHGQFRGDPQTRSYRFKADYLPITQRQMKQSWRYLRKSVREGPPVEFDVEATVEKVAREGRLFHPVMRPRRINRAAMVLLVDQEGSMVPFHGFSRRLVETAVRGGKLGQTNVYYFNNYPQNVLYCNPYFSESRTLEAVMGGLHPTRTAVLIFSDAGAARDRYSFERVDMTRAFLRRLTQAVRYVAWLNPMPMERWAHTSAAAIAQSVSMFEISREGLQDAIDVLRGRTIPRR